MSGSTKRLVLLGLLLAAVTAATFLPAVDHGFVHFDDGMYVTDNPWVRGGLSTEGAAWALTTFHASNWHPLTWLSHMLDAEIGGTDPRVHHASSVAFHLANTLLLFLVFHAMTGSAGRSAVVAALFGVHPLHVESVAWVAERKDVLSTCFGLLAIAAHVRFVRSPSLARGGLVALALALSLAAKPMLVTLPLLLILLDAWPLGRRGGTWIEKLPLFALAAASSIVTLVAQRAGGAMRSLEQIPLAERAGNAAVAYVAYLGKTLWPADLAAFYPRAPGRGWETVAALAALAAVTALGWRLRRRRPYVLVGWLWYLISLVPVIGLVQVGEQAMADRYTYVPLIGIFAIAAWGGADLLAALRAPRGTGPAIAFVVVAVLALLARGQVGVWRDSVTLFEHALAVTKDNAVAHANLGVALAERGRAREAIAHYERAIGINPNYARVFTNLANALAAEGRREEAYARYADALRLDPGGADPNYNLAVQLARDGRLEEAIDRYRRALEDDSDDARIHNNLGSALARLDRLPEATAHFERAVRLDPFYGMARSNLGMSYQLSGRDADAWREYREARRLGYEPPESMIRALSERTPEPPR